MVTNEEKLPKLELKESRSTTCLQLEIKCCTNAVEIKCCTNATQDCEVFIESKIVPLETDSLTEELMQNEVQRGASDFGTKDLLVLKDKGLVVAT